MIRKNAQGLPPDRGAMTAANEEFAIRGTRSTPMGLALRAWDPYEVWRTRVRSSAQAALDAGLGSQLPPPTA